MARLQIADVMVEAAREYDHADHTLLPWQEEIRRDEINKEMTRRGLSMPDAA